MARVPGSTTRSASASSSGRVAQRTSTPGSWASASRSVKFDSRGKRSTATRSTSAPSGPRAAVRSTTVDRSSESSASSHRSGSIGRVPSTGRPVSSRSISSPGASSRASPRNLLTNQPATCRWSSADSSASVPYIAANTPPRSMSPTTTTGRPAAVARPMLAMSRSRRLISAGEPAPSQTTTSKRARRSARHSRARSSSSGLRSR